MSIGNSESRMAKLGDVGDVMFQDKLYDLVRSDVNK